MVSLISSSVKESSDDVASSNTSNAAGAEERARSRAVAFLLRNVKPLDRKPDQGCVLSGALGARTSCTAGSFKTAEKDGSTSTVDNSYSLRP